MDLMLEAEMAQYVADALDSELRKRLAQDRHYTQEMLANDIGLEPETLRRLLSKGATRMDIPNLIAISNALGPDFLRNLGYRY